MNRTPKWIYSGLPQKPSWVEKIFFGGGRRVGKTEQVRQQVKMAIEGGKSVIVSDAPNINAQPTPQNGDDSTQCGER